MTKAEISRGKKVIAKFMGLIYRTTPNYTGWYVSTKTEKYAYRIGGNDSLRYHASWDCLMPVISKITSMDEYQTFKNETSSMVSEGGIDINPKYMENTYSQVVEFIDWYNKNK